MRDIPFGELEDFMANLSVFYEVRCMHCYYRQECILQDEADIRAKTHEETTEHDCEIVTAILRGDLPESLGFGEVDETADREQ